MIVGCLLCRKPRIVGSQLLLQRTSKLLAGISPDLAAMSFIVQCFKQFMPGVLFEGHANSAYPDKTLHYALSNHGIQSLLL